MELRQSTQQVIPVGVLLTKQIKLTDPLNPVYGASLSWYFWRHLIKPDGTTVDIVNHTWSDIPSCAGCYNLTLTEQDTAICGTLMLYIFDASSLGKPIFMELKIIKQNVWDSKYGDSLLITESHAKGG